MKRLLIYFTCKKKERKKIQLISKLKKKKNEKERNLKYLLNNKMKFIH